MTIAQISAGTLPPARPASSETPASGEGDFAQLMALQAPAEPAADAAPQSHADDARQAKARQAGRSFARGTQPEARRDMAQTHKTERAPGDAEAADGADRATDPALAQWLAQWHRPPAEAAAPEPGDTRKSLPDTSAAEAVDPQGKPPLPEANGLASGLADGRAAPGHPAARGAEKTARERMPAIDNAAPATRDEVAGADASAREPAPATSGSAFALPAGFEPAQAAATPATPAPTPLDGGAVAVPLPVPLESPEFAAAFGVEISLLAKDGVQQAELHLNPAEMGPVSVQIALDGEKARIDFGAQAAATRAAIEASLPELAAALRDAGLTLAGGGVTQHAGQGSDPRGNERRDDEGSAGRSGRPLRSEASGATAARPAWRGRVSASGVDLYA